MAGTFGLIVGFGIGQFRAERPVLHEALDGPLPIASADERHGSASMREPGPPAVVRDTGTTDRSASPGTPPAVGGWSPPADSHREPRRSRQQRAVSERLDAMVASPGDTDGRPGGVDDGAVLDGSIEDATNPAVRIGSARVMLNGMLEGFIAGAEKAPSQDRTNQQESEGRTNR